MTPLSLPSLLILAITTISAGVPSTAGGQVTGVSGTGGAGTGDASNARGCAQPPCSSKARTQQHIVMPLAHVRTPEELEEGQLQDVFAELAGQEQTAKREEAAGHPEAAVYWRGYFSRRSGLTPEETEIVRKVGTKYDEQFWAFQIKRRETTLAVRRANPGMRMTRSNSPEVAALEEERKSLFINAKSELVAALGSKSFTRLDSYMIHSHDHEKSLGSLPAPIRADSVDSATTQRSLSSKWTVK